MQGALTMLTRGYFREGVTLIRAAFEDWGTQKYLQKHPEKAALYPQIAIDEPFARKRGIPLFTDIWAELEGMGQQAAPRVYDQLCSYAHPRGPGLRTTRDRDAEGFWVHAVPHFDPQACRQGLGYWFQVAQLQLRATQELQKAILGELASVWSERGQALSSQLGQAMSDLAKEIVNHALDRVGEALKEEGVTLEGWVESARSVREKLVEERYGSRPGQPEA
jgi:hypothetical protein